MQIAIDEKRFYGIVKEAVLEAVKEEMAKLRLQIIPYVSDKEMKEIEDLFGPPGKYKNQELEELEI